MYLIIGVTIRVHSPSGKVKPRPAGPEELQYVKKDQKMQYADNWKYIKWEGEMKKSPYDTEYNLRIYRSLEIYPEDIEIFMTVLMPKIFEIDGKVFFDIDGDGEPLVREAYQKKDPIKRSESERQKDWNCINVGNIFFNNLDNSTDETLMNISMLIKHNWEYYLIKQYPDRRFIVEIIGDSFEPIVTFYEA